MKSRILNVFILFLKDTEGKSGEAKQRRSVLLNNLTCFKMFKNKKSLI